MKHDDKFLQLRQNPDKSGQHLVSLNLRSRAGDFSRHFQAVSLNEFMEKPYKKGTFHLSFDDGVKECTSIIAPILKQKGIPATFFINPAFVDNKTIFHKFLSSAICDFLHDKKEAHLIEEYNQLEISYQNREKINEFAGKIGLDLSPVNPYMNKEDINSLVKDGFSIGAHSWDHPEFWLLNDDEQFLQIQKSVDWVSKEFSQPIKSFAFPFTDVGVSDSVFERIKTEQIVDLSFGTAGFKAEIMPMHFQRIVMENNLWDTAEQTIKSEILQYKLKRFTGRHIATR